MQNRLVQYIIDIIYIIADIRFFKIPFAQTLPSQMSDLDGAVLLVMKRVEFERTHWYDDEEASIQLDLEQPTISLLGGISDF